MSTSPHQVRAGRRALAMALALMALLAALATGAAPAGAAPTKPGTPGILTIDRYDEYFIVDWVPNADNGGSPITGYNVWRQEEGKVPTLLNFGAKTTSFRDNAPVNGVKYRYAVQAKNAIGLSELSPFSEYTLTNAINVAWRPYPNPGAAVIGLYNQILHRSPTVAERTAAAASLTNGSKSTADLILFLSTASDRQAYRLPAARLYDAYFKRFPDHGGLTFWENELRSGKKYDLYGVSQFFASHDEFKKTYGPAVTDTEFLYLVYNNVLDRDPDAAGLQFWLQKMKEGRTRGYVMIQFSEVEENTKAMHGLVDAVDIYDSLLGKTPPANDLEFTAWAAHIQAGGNTGTYGAHIMTTPAYTNHILG